MELSVDDLALTPSEEVPRRVLALQKATRARWDQRFPPDVAGAQELLAEAMERAPFEPLLWTELAWIRINEGRSGEAAAALATAEALAPANPLLRNETAPLYSALGDRDRAIESALSNARLDPAGRTDAARALLQSGLTPPEVYDLLLPLAEDPAEASRLALLLLGNNREFNQAVFGQMPQAALSVSDTSSQLARRLMNPVVPAALLRVWRRNAPEGLRTVSGTPILYGPREPTLAVFDRAAFPLGWQPLPMNRFVSGSLDEGGEFGRRVRVELEHNGGRSAAWQFHQFVLPAGSPALQAMIEVTADPPGSATVEFQAQAAGRRHRGESLGEEGARVLRVMVPSSREGEVASLVLQMRHNGGAGDARVLVGNLSIAVAEEAPASE